MIVPNPGAVAVRPCQWHLGAQPIWGEHRQAIQGMAQGLAHTLQAGEDANGSGLIGGVDALASVGFEEPRSRPWASKVSSSRCSVCPATRRVRNSLGTVWSKPGSMTSRLTVYFPFIRLRMASAAWGCDKPPAHGNTVVKASR
jgi:hypothetical protein